MAFIKQTFSLLETYNKVNGVFNINMQQVELILFKDGQHPPIRTSR